MQNSALQQKREQFVVQIRKQAREEIFQRKRHTTIVPMIEQQYTPDEWLQFIYQCYTEKDYQQLTKILYKYSQHFLNVLQQPNEQLQQFLQHLQNETFIKIFLDLIRITDLPQEYNIPKDRLDCMNQVLVILINFTYVTPILQLSEPLLNDVLNRINKKEKLLNNFDRWSAIFESLCQILINQLIDADNNTSIYIKQQILHSPLIKIWHFIYTKNPTSRTWNIVIQLERMLFRQPSIADMDITSHNIIKIIQQCSYLIDQMHITDELYCQILELLVSLSDYQVSTTLTLTKFVWQKILQRNQYPLQYLSMFINFTSLKCDDYQIEQYLIDIGLIENMAFHLQSDERLIIKIYKCFNNIIFYNNYHIVEMSIQYFLPYLYEYFQKVDTYNQQIIEEYYFLIRNLISHQTLTDQNYLYLIEQHDVVQQIALMYMIITIFTSLKSNMNVLKSTTQVFFKLDKVPKLHYKELLLSKIAQHQIVEIFNYLSTRIVDEGYIDSIFEILQNWESQTSELFS